MIAKEIDVLTNTTLPGYAAKGTVDPDDLIGSFYSKVGDVVSGPKEGLYQLKAKEVEEETTTGYFIKYVTSKSIEVDYNTYQLITG